VQQKNTSQLSDPEGKKLSFDCNPILYLHLDRPSTIHTFERPSLKQTSRDRDLYLSKVRVLRTPRIVPEAISRDFSDKLIVTCDG